jgi:hypothetical protein
LSHKEAPSWGLIIAPIEEETREERAIPNFFQSIAGRYGKDSWPIKREPIYPSHNLAMLNISPQNARLRGSSDEQNALAYF